MSCQSEHTTNPVEKPRSVYEDIAWTDSDGKTHVSNQRTRLGSCLKKFPAGCRGKGKVLYEYLELIPATLNGKKIFVVAWKPTHAILSYHFHLLYVTTDSDPTVDIMLDYDRKINLRDPKFAGKNYFNEEVKTWEEDPNDYKYDNASYWRENEQKWIEEYGKGAYVTLARKTLVAVHDSPLDQYCCPARMLFNDYIGCKIHEFSPGIKCYESMIFPEPIGEYYEPW